MLSRTKRYCRKYLTTPVCVALCILGVVLMDWRLRVNSDPKPVRAVGPLTNMDYTENNEGHGLTVRRVETTRGSRLLRLRYRPPPHAGTLPLGAGFFLDEDLVKTLHLPPAKLFYLNKRTAGESLVFVTASSDHHFTESEAAVASIQHLKPGRNIIYYDLGLTAHQAHTVKSWCHVIYKRFPFEHYPAHVRDLQRMAWKQLVIQDALHEYGGIFWINPQQRLQTSHLDDVFVAAVQSGGLVHFRTTPHSNFDAIEHNTYVFLPTDKEKQQLTRQVATSAMVIYNTESTFWNVLIWWYLCALEQRCQSSPDVPKCVFNADGVPEHPAGHKSNATCSLFDQSVLNLLESNYYGYNFHKYTYLDKPIVGAHTNRDHHLKKC